MKIQILFPSNPSVNDSVDNYFLNEYLSVSKMENVHVLLFDYANYLKTNTITIIGKIDKDVTTIYRGWKLDSKIYEKLFYYFDGSLINDPISYNKYRFPSKFLNLNTNILDKNTYISNIPYSNNNKFIDKIINDLKSYHNIYPKIKFNAILKDSSKSFYNKYPNTPYIVNYGSDIESKIKDFVSKMGNSFKGSLNIVEYFTPNISRNHLKDIVLNNHYRCFCFSGKVVGGFHMDSYYSNTEISIPIQIIDHVNKFLKEIKIYDFVSIDIVKTSQNVIKIVWIDDAQVTNLPNKNVNWLSLYYYTLVEKVRFLVY